VGRTPKVKEKVGRFTAKFVASGRFGENCRLDGQVVSLGQGLEKLETDGGETNLGTRVTFVYARIAKKVVMAARRRGCV